MHLLEYYVPYFLRELTPAQTSKLRALKDLHINVMNQNIQLMPAPEVIEQLRQLTPHLTITTAHSSYTTPALRQLYAAPTHLLSAWFEQQEIEVVPYRGKENIMMVSPDEHPDKVKILTRIRQAFPALQLIVIQNMKYDDFKVLEAKAKWSISFGEGFDGYTIFPVLKGESRLRSTTKTSFCPSTKRFPRSTLPTRPCTKILWRTCSGWIRSRLTKRIIAKSPPCAGPITATKSICSGSRLSIARNTRCPKPGALLTPTLIERHPLLPTRAFSCLANCPKRMRKSGLLDQEMYNYPELT
ncbi:hypothetical protein [Hymenobacter volaticus]|uniref:LysR substrate-binding domain-containing protein n=1 Tax=Hymenobacter volaticus TaxID=2932254 RepID=A0ABY4GDI7_9BACT|nr:hypothetical protein [Hymenobacter volaticus]UOQ68948.1 hypothetical protein MUN86_24910 [Hymenobacter volaticus]